MEQTVSAFFQVCLRFLSTNKMDSRGERLEAKRSVRNLGQLDKGQVKALEKRRWEKAGCERNGN